MKIINKKEVAHEKINLLDIIESEGGYFYQIHPHESSSGYAIVCLNDCSRGVMSRKGNLPTLEDAVKYIKTISNIKEIHSVNTTVLELRNVSSKES